jgi:phosphate acetyltransferase
MKSTIFLAPAGSSVGLTTVALGLVRATDRIGLRVAFFKPIGQTVAGESQLERSTYFIRKITRLPSADPIPIKDASRFVSSGHIDEMMGRIIERYHESADKADVALIEGLVPTMDNPYTSALNVELVKALDAHVVLVCSVANGDIRHQLEMAARPFGGLESEKIVGCALNHIPKPETGEIDMEALRKKCAELRPGGIALVAAIPSNPELTYCRTIDVSRELDARVLNEGDIETRRVKSVAVLARTVPNMLSTFRPGALLVTPTDRTDVIIAVSMASRDMRTIAGIVLTGGLEVDPRIMDFCKPAFDTGLPVLAVKMGSYETGTVLSKMSREIPWDDVERMAEAMDYVADHCDEAWLRARPHDEHEKRMSPAAFFYQLTERARAVPRRILLPEGDEPRTVRAAIFCHEQRIANCVLIGDPAEIKRVASTQDMEIPDGLEILDPSEIRDRYVDPMLALRKGKGLPPSAAADQLTDNVVLGTVMLAIGEADGLVSGAVHSSANTVRPALKLIKARPGAKVVSSIFFMCLPDQVLIYGDCAINPDPNAEELADIALQSADSASAFGITPRVAMISYSTGKSGSGADVDKVRKATEIAKALRPDLLIDGPLQYDAASTEDVARSKAPDSPVAGRATVFVFPDLNTGNTTYKAVQRSANVISVGPMLQGLKRPVNDLSRGALVKDIIYTIALTAIQAEQNIDIVI